MTKIRKRIEPPFRLNMSFDEALTRFANTSPVELGRQIATNMSHRKETGMNRIEWFKTLSTTDAQQPTTGGIVPYLRLTKGSLKKEDFQSWFRDVLFSNAAWEPGNFGKENDLEITNISAQVIIGGVDFGSRSFTVTHGPNRKNSNNTPNTWLHWPPEIQHILQLNDYSGCEVRLTRRESGRYDLTVSSR